MDHPGVGNGIHVPIYIDSSDSSDFSDGPSTVTFQTIASAVHGVVNQDAPEYVDGVVNSYSIATMTFETAAVNSDHGGTVPIQTIQVPFASNGDNGETTLIQTIQVPFATNGDNGETIPIQTIQVPFARDLTSDEVLAQRVSPQLSITKHGNTQNMLNESLGFHVQSDDINLPEQASTAGLRRSSRKRNEVYYYEGPTRRQPSYKNAREKPHRGESSKKKFTSLRIRASNYPFDEVEESE